MGQNDLILSHPIEFRVWATKCNSKPGKELTRAGGQNATIPERQAICPNLSIGTQDNIRNARPRSPGRFISHVALATGCYELPIEPDAGALRLIENVGTSSVTRSSEISEGGSSSPGAFARVARHEFLCGQLGDFAPLRESNPAPTPKNRRPLRRGHVQSVISAAQVRHRLGSFRPAWSPASPFCLRTAT
jgi:hypothetical protein